MKTARKMAITIVLFSASLPAQNQGALVPLNSGSIDYITQVTTSVNSLVTADAGMFVSEGQKVLTSLAVIMFCIYGLKWSLQSSSRHHHEFDFPALVHFLSLFLVAEMLLRFYNQPLWFVGMSVHQVLPEIGRQLAGFIDIRALDKLLAEINKIYFSTEAPGFLNPMIIVYWIVLGAMTVLQAVLFAATCLGFVAVGVSALLGPIFIPWLIVPRLSWLFWNWLSFTLQYSFYQVIAAALTAIWSGAIVSFFTNSINGDYSLGHLFFLAPALIMFCFAMTYSIFKIPFWVHDLFSGASSAAGEFGSRVSGAIRGAFR